MAQQTAVEWLIKQIQSIEFTTIDTSDFLECRMHFNTFNKFIKQAKQMEKEQIKEAYCKGDDNIGAEQYYNEIYGKSDNL